MINDPPINSQLAVLNNSASWSKPWANWFTQVWQQLVYLINAPTVTVTSAYQALLTDSVILINGNVTVTLPTAAKAQGKRFTVKAINAGAGTRTVSGNGSNIDASGTWTTTTQYAGVDIVSDGSQYWIV